jgi:hypothetical protein
MGTSGCTCKLRSSRIQTQMCYELFLQRLPWFLHAKDTAVHVSERGRESALLFPRSLFVAIATAGHTPVWSPVGKHGWLQCPLWHNVRDVITSTPCLSSNCLHTEFARLGPLKQLVSFLQRSCYRQPMPVSASCNHRDFSVETLFSGMPVFIVACPGDNLQHHSSAPTQGSCYRHPGPWYRCCAVAAIGCWAMAAIGCWVIKFRISRLSAAQATPQLGVKKMLATQSAFPLGSLTEKLGTAPRPPPPPPAPAKGPCSHASFCIPHPAPPTFPSWSHSSRSLPKEFFQSAKFVYLTTQWTNQVGLFTL